MTLVPRLLAELEKKGFRIWIEGGASNDQLSALERALGVPMPPSYAEFLRRFGAIGIGDSSVSGIVDGNALAEEGSSVYGDTLQFRAYQEFPHGFLVIRKHEDGAFCLDSTRPTAEGEYPVVNFEFGSSQHEKPVASSFEDWLIRFQLNGPDD